MSLTVGSASVRKLYALLLVSQLFRSNVSKLLDIDEVTSVYDSSVFGENDVWSTLYQQCGKDTSYQCVESSVYSYLDRTLESDFVTDVVAFRHNDNNYTDICRRVKKDNPGDFDEREERKLDFPEDDTEFSEFINKIEGIEGISKKNARKGRNMDTSESKDEDSTLESEKKPKPIVNKNILDISDILYNRGVKYLMTHDMEFTLPSLIFGDGRIKISPQGFAEDGGALVKLNVIPDQPQEGRFFFKQIQKLFKKKLMTSMMAAVLIMKLLKLKMMFFLPVLLGVGTAKKILLKVLLFLFPALAHLFKLCSYYHHKHAKFHHHHHQIAHHHHHVPVPVYTHAHSAPGELPAPYPAASYEISGPGVYSHSRTEMPGTLTDLAAWGLGEYPASWDSPGVTDPPRYTYPTRPQPVGSPQTYHSHLDLKRLSQYSVPKTPTNVQYNQALTSRLQALTPRPPSGYDPFYSPMLARLEAVFNQLGVLEEGCRERLVCSMYKNPARFTPHSNLVSAELSRDPSELQKPQTANTAAVRFYRYMAAARDGQELKDCLRLYAACSLATE